MTSPREAVRDALATWLRDGNIPGLDRVHVAFPMRLDFNSYGSGPTRCQAFIVIDDDDEVRISLGGEHSGKKRIDYGVSLEVYHRSTLPDTEESQRDFDRVIDAIKARLRADRRLGETDEAIVWQAGEGQYGIQGDYQSAPSVGGEALENSANLQFEVTQWITS